MAAQQKDVCASCPCLASPPAHFAFRSCHNENHSHQNYTHLNSFFFGNCLGTADCRNEMAQNWLNNVYANTDVVRALFSYSSRSSLSKAFGPVSGLLSSSELVGAWFGLGNYQNPAETLFWCIFFPSLTSAICGASGLPSHRSCLCLLISALPSKAFASRLLLVPKSPMFSDTVSVTWLTAALLWFYSISVHPALLVRGLLALLKAWC